MKKKLIITAVVAVVVIVGVLLYMHYSPVWVNISNVAAVIAGLVAGWYARVLYAKYVIEDEKY